MKQYSKYAALLALSSLTTTDAFAVGPTPQPRASSALSLIPGQGNQLVAAYNAASCHEKGDVATAPVEEETDSSASHSRSFVSRVFSLPAAVISRHPHSHKETTDDVVLYPIVGFQFFHDANGDCIPLPTTSHAACRIRRPSQEEELVGWFSPACNLDMFTEDEDACHEPKDSAE